MFLGGLFVLSCSQGPAESQVTRDVDAFVESSEASSLDAAWLACDGVSDAVLADGCRLEVVRSHGVVDPARCAVIDTVVWRDEFFFVAAEAAIAEEREPGDETVQGPEAGRFCEQAGQFEAQCQGHVMNARFKVRTQDCTHPVECMARDRPLVDQAAARFAADGATVQSLWTDYFTQGLRDPRVTRLDRCQSATSAADLADCRSATFGFMYRQVLHWLTGPDQSSEQRAQACAAGVLPEAQAAGVFDVTDPEPLAASRVAVRFACLTEGTRLRLALPWNVTSNGDGETDRIVAVGEPAGCDTLRFPPMVRGCRDSIHASVYQDAGAACAGAVPRHPVHCVESARLAVAAAHDLDPTVDVQREWRAYYFEHLWRHLPQDRAACRAAGSAADRVTCEQAVEEAVTGSPPTAWRARMWHQSSGRKCVRAGWTRCSDGPRLLQSPTPVSSKPSPRS